LSGKGNIHNDAHYVASNNFLVFEKMLKWFVTLINISPSPIALTTTLQMSLETFSLLQINRVWECWKCISPHFFARRVGVVVSECFRQF